MTALARIALLIVALASTALHAQDLPTITITFERGSVWQMLNTLSRDYKLKIAYDSRAFRKLESGPFAFVNAVPEDVLAAIMAPHGYRPERVARVWVLVEAEKTSVVPTSVKAEVEFSGRVVDDYTGEGLPGSTLRLLSGGRAFGSGPEGYFHLIDIPFDTSLVVVSYLGYHSLCVPAAQSAGNTIRLKRNLAALPPAIVTAEPSLLLSGVGNSAIALDAIVARTMAGTGEPDIMRAVQMLSGVSATTDSGSGLEIRGSSESMSLTTLDGFTIYHTDHFFGNVSAVNPDFVRNAVVYKGPVPADKGGAAAGLLELSGRTGNRYREQVKAGLSALSGHLTLSLPFKNNKGAFVFSGRRSYTDLLPGVVYRQLFGRTFSAGVPLSDPEDTSLAENRFRYADAAFRVHFEASERKQISFTVLTGNDKLGLKYDSPTSLPGFRFIYDEESEWGHTGAGFAMTDKLNNGDLSYLGVFGSRFQSFAGARNLRENLWFGYTDTLFSRQTNRISDVGARWNYIRNRASVAWNVGAEIKRVEVSYRSFLPDNLAAEATDNLSGIAALFFQRDHSLTPKTNLTAGGRAETNDFGFLYPAGHLALRHELSDHLSLTAEVGRQNMFVQRLTRQTIGLSEPVLWQIADGQTALVTRSDQVAMGLKWDHEKFSFLAEVYSRWLFDVNVHRSTLPVVSARVDLPSILHGDAQAIGLDLMYTYGHSGHRAIISSSLGISMMSLPDLQPETFYAASNQTVQIKGLYAYKWRLWEPAFTAIAGYGRPYTPYLGSYTLPLINGGARQIDVFGRTNSDFLPVYLRLDFLLTRSFDFEKFSGSVGVNVYNVLDRANVRDVRYFAVGNPDEPERHQVVTNNTGMPGRMMSLILTIEL